VNLKLRINTNQWLDIQKSPRQIVIDICTWSIL